MRIRRVRIPHRTMDDNFSDLQKLLRLKRFEAPPPEYFENFLQDFQARQRREIVKLPLWRIVWDRMSASLAPVEVPQLGYAAACAVALFAAVVTSKQILSTPTPAPALATTSVRTSLPTNVQPVQFPQVNLQTGNQVVFLNGADFPSFDAARARAARSTTASRAPRYVLDSRPVSYEAPASF